MYKPQKNHLKKLQFLIQKNIVQIFKYKKKQLSRKKIFHDNEKIYKKNNKIYIKLIKDLGQSVRCVFF